MRLGDLFKKNSPEIPRIDPNCGAVIVEYEGVQFLYFTIVRTFKEDPIPELLYTARSDQPGWEKHLEMHAKYIS